MKLSALVAGLFLVVATSSSFAAGQKGGPRTTLWSKSSGSGGRFRTPGLLKTVRSWRVWRPLSRLRLPGLRARTPAARKPAQPKSLDAEIQSYDRAASALAAGKISGWASQKFPAGSPMAQRILKEASSRKDRFGPNAEVVIRSDSAGKSVLIRAGSKLED